MTTLHDWIARFTLAASVTLLAACSSSTDSDTGAGGAAAENDAQADAPGDAVALNPLCVAACATVRTCYAQLEESACQHRCSVELTGTGYLIPEIATQYFQLLAEAGSDPDCALTHFSHWRPDELNPDGFELVVEDQATLQECFDAMDFCVGSSSAATRDACFMLYYRYNTPYREKIRACFPYEGYFEACMQQEECICQNQFEDQPWIAMPCREGGVDGCPCQSWF